NDTYNELKKLGSDSYTDYINKYEMPDIYGDHILNATTLSTGTTPEEIASTAFDCRINGVAYTVAAADSTFTAADTINTGAAAGSFWGVWLIQVNSAGTISTSSPSADQVYTTEALAIAALPSVTADNVSIGYVAVQSNSGASWTANTDDLTAGSDCLDLNYYNTASAIDADQNTEWPLYYYIMPTSTVGTLRIIILPLPEESKTEALYIRYWKYLPDLSNTVETWDAYEDEISTNCPDLLIWMGVADIAVTQENQNLAMMAQSKIALHKSEFKNLNFTQKNANMGRIPYRWI
ncbi:hypothetical protein, partial [Neptuniibacter sp.]|uniref:hypothetical protein n=1 Tax=Neptuniibacter sp. TaxID=1962643 RepID=UPI0026097D18